MQSKAKRYIIDKSLNDMAYKMQDKANNSSKFIKNNYLIWNFTKM